MKAICDVLLERSSEHLSNFEEAHASTRPRSFLSQPTLGFLLRPGGNQLGGILMDSNSPLPPKGIEGL
jgi:hypothetical protein